MPQDHNKHLQERIEKQADRMRQAEHERPTLIAQTAYIGRLGLVFVIPVIGGAYLGRWIDSLFSGYSMRWTLSLIFLGVVIGAFNIYLVIKE